MVGTRAGRGRADGRGERIRFAARRGTGRRLWLPAVLLALLAAGVAAAVPAQARTTAVGRDAASSGHTACVPSGEGGTTCTGTDSGDNAWDWYLNDESGGMSPSAPTVSVDQTVNLTNQMVHVSWANFTPSGFEGEGDPAAGLSNGYKAALEFYPVFVVECKGSNPASFDACNTLTVGTPSTGAAGNAVESYTQDGATTQATDCTDVPNDTQCGRGYTDIQIQTKLQNDNLGCDSSDPCSLVVLPNWGGNTYAQPADCEDHSLDLPADGGYASTQYGNFTACMWYDRVVVPLSFAPTSQQYCPSNDYAFTAAGSPMLEAAMAQWQPGWCSSASGKLDFDYDSGMNEYDARRSFLSSGQALSSGTDLALVTDPPSADQSAGSSRKFTYAPIATTSISIVYYVDSQVTQEPITNLKLDARLVAKLLTQSYSLVLGDCSTGQTAQSDTCDPAVAGNPQSIFDDPEFLALNPEYTGADFSAFTLGPGEQGAFLPMVVAGNSDLVYELTRWVVSDPDARSFLEGEPDQWGMHVNRNYLGAQEYPVSQLQNLDPGFTQNVNDPAQANDPYYETMQESWIPVTGLDNIAAHLAGWTSSDLQFNALCSNPAFSLKDCAGHGNIVNQSQPPEQFPDRSLFAVVDSGTAAAYRFPTAALVNPAGNAVAPTTGSMSAAVGAMKTNPDKITQYQDYTATAANAYPLTEVQYAMVPTCGLTSAKARAIGTFLQDVASSQTYGVGLGQIPPFGGYLALDDAQRQQDATAAAAVSTQSCTTAPGDSTVSGGKPQGQTGGGITTGQGGAPGTGSLPTGAATGAAAPSPHATAGASATASPSPIGLGEKAADTSGDVKYILPAALGAGALLAIGGPLAYGLGGTGGIRRPRLPWAGRGAPAAGAAGPDPGNDPGSADAGAAQGSDVDG